MADKDFLQKENQRLKNQINMMELQIKGYEECIQQMKGSISWRLTEPLRWCKEKCTPLREGIWFIKNIKKQGFQSTLRQLKLNHVNYKHPYRPELFSFEMKEQIEKRDTIPVNYHAVIYMYEENQGFLEDTIKSVVNQSILPMDIMVIIEDRNLQSSLYKNIESMQKNNVMIQIMEYKEFEQLSKDIQMGDQLIFITSDVILTQNCIYEIEMERQNTMANVIYGDDAILNTPNHYEYRYKPDYAPHYLMSENYVGNMLCVNVDTWKQIVKNNNFNDGMKSSIVYNIMLVANEEWTISHIPKIISGVKGTLDYTLERDKYSRENYWLKKEEGYYLEDGLVPGSQHVIYRYKNEEPLVSILIPNCDHVKDLELCLRSIKEKSSYSNIEIIIIENNSKDKATFCYYQQLEKEGIRILYWDREFNYSAINNYAVQYAKGEYILLLNNDIEILAPNWIEEMLTYARRKEVGAVGAKLYFPDNTIQHAGVILGIRRLAGHAFRGLDMNEEGYLHRTMVVQDYSIVTAACLLVEKKKFLQCGGFDEQLAVDYNDVDLCMKLRKSGYYNVYTPFAQMYHYESKSRGDSPSPENKARKEREFYYFNTKWYQEIVKGDPFYNKNLTLLDDSFSIRKKKEYLSY